MRISDWSSDVCSTDLDPARRLSPRAGHLHDTLAKADAAPLGVFLDRIDLAVVARHIFRALAGQRADKTGVVLEVVAPIVKRHALAVTRHPDIGSMPVHPRQIGRASCRESVCQYV